MSWQNNEKSMHQKNRKKGNQQLYQEVKRRDRAEKQERLHFLEVVSESMQLPPDVLTGAPIITMYGRNNVSVENHKKILEYSENSILIQTGLCRVLVEGKRLKIDFFTREEMKISGMIHQISYLGNRQNSG